MKRAIVLLTVLSLVIVTATTPGAAADNEPNFDPDEVDIASLEGEDPDQVNELAIDINDTIHIELDGLDEPDQPLLVEIGGAEVGRMEEADAEVRPYSGSNVSTGQQTLQIVWESRGERTIVAETEVRVTEVNLERDGGGSDLGFDPENISIDAIAGQDADGVTEIEVVENEAISIELEGADAADIFANVELGGTAVGAISGNESSFTPRDVQNVSEGAQTLVLVREPEDGRTIIAETQVDVTPVARSGDGSTELEFDPADVTLASVNGEDPADLELALEYTEEISIRLEGLDASEHLLQIALDGTTIGILGQNETAFRPVADADVETGEQRLTILTRAGQGGQTVVAETTVTVTEVDLTRDTNGGQQAEVDAESISIVSVNEEPADQRNEIELDSRSPVSIELSGAAIPDRGFHVEIGGTGVGMLGDAEDVVRIRQDSDVPTGEQTLEIVWEGRDNRTVVAETPVAVIDADQGPEERQGEEARELADLEITAVNGKAADGIVVIEHDLRKKTPIELKVDGLADTDHEPRIKYKGETLFPDMEEYEIANNTIAIAHLPGVEDGEVETLTLVKKTGAQDVHEYDSVEIQYKHVEGADASSSGTGSSDEADGETGESDESSSETGASDESGSETGASDESGSETGASDESGSETGVGEDSSGETGEEDDGGIVSGIIDFFSGGDDSQADHEQSDGNKTADATEEGATDDTDEAADDGGLISAIQDLFDFGF